MFKIIETFVSIDGEGPTSGELATFIRFSGCNLRCAWCDTTYSWDGSSCVTKLSLDELYEQIKRSKTKNVTLTGGEPLIQPNIELLLDRLAADQTLSVHIETNGSVDITPLKARYKHSNIHFVLDYKCLTSQMHKKMCEQNFQAVDEKDVYKFVIGSVDDLNFALEMIMKYELSTRCRVYFSPVTELIEPAKIVEFMKENQLNDVRLQLQLHKYIWPKEMRGV
ncbi:MAG: putative 7-carboxy-7-deazaguanine synthase QueE [Turicibacter sp.]|nr:putative 7-carboxy-7-deazaguanine synthase QueE [Turicibacter sp.]